MKTRELKMSRIKKLSYYTLWILFLLYLLSIIIVNVTGKLWYSMDMYADAYVARLMSEQKTLFPENWIFGNQYYVIATPVISALFYGVIKDSFLSMAFASTVMLVVTIILFTWCFRGGVSNTGTVIGLFCITGGIILGNNASEYVNGFQCLYTMCSYYACYLIGILLQVGIYLRILSEKRVSLGLIVLSAVVGISLGMQSPREMLILNIPLVFLELVNITLDRRQVKTIEEVINKHKWAIAYVIGMLISNGVGMLWINQLNIAHHSIIQMRGIELNPVAIWENAKSCGQDLLRITGLSFAGNGFKWIPLFVAAVFVFSTVVLSLLLIIMRKDRGWLANIILFSVISIMCVFGAGVLVIKTRAVYYFVWYLLSSAASVYVFETIGEKKRYFILSMVLCVGMLNYIFNFLPDLIDYKEKEVLYRTVANTLVDDGIDCMYVDIHTSPRIPLYSHDRIVSGTFLYDYEEENGYMLKALEYLKPTDIFEERDNDTAVICLSNWSFEHLKTAPTSYTEKLFSILEPIAEYQMGGNLKYYIYRAPRQLISK